MKKAFVVLLALVLLIPAVALGESAALPYGLRMGMDTAETLAAFAADASLGTLTPDITDYGNGAVEYLFTGVQVTDTDITADTVSVRVDRNNSMKNDRLTTVVLEVAPAGNSIAAFRRLLTALTAAYGAPENDPFDEASADMYVTWGTLNATWTLADSTLALTLNRMYQEAITVQFTSRFNYDKADLTE